MKKVPRTIHGPKNAARGGKEGRGAGVMPAILPSTHSRTLRSGRKRGWSHCLQSRITLREAASNTNQIARIASQVDRNRHRCAKGQRVDFANGHGLMPPVHGLERAALSHCRPIGFTHLPWLLGTGVAAAPFELASAGCEPAGSPVAKFPSWLVEIQCRNETRATAVNAWVKRSSEGTGSRAHCQYSGTSSGRSASSTRSRPEATCSCTSD